jgi:glucosamine--fructose-6-phosphate aminotransferase (isomerizing)
MEKTISNLTDAAGRGGKITLITADRGGGEAGAGVPNVIAMPEVNPFVAPIVAAVPIQLLAYHTAVFMGTDVDQPRNLAKSVTVE